MCHVVVRSEELHFGFARVNHEHNIIDSDGGLSDIGGQDDLWGSSCFRITLPRMGDILPS